MQLCLSYIYIYNIFSSASPILKIQASLKVSDHTLFFVCLPMYACTAFTKADRSGEPLWSHFDCRPLFCLYNFSSLLYTCTFTLNFRRVMQQPLDNICFCLSYIYLYIYMYIYSQSHILSFFQSWQSVTDQVSQSDRILFVVRVSVSIHVAFT